MNKLHDQNVRLAPWMGCTLPAVEQTAFIDHALEHARSWLRHGERKLELWRLQQMQARRVIGVQAN